MNVTDGTLPLIGVHPALGRTFTKEDDAPGPADTAMISHAYWLRAFNGSPTAIGQQLIVNGRAREIIGVLPEGFTFLRYNPQVVLPFRFNRAEIFLGNFSYQGVARLKPGVTIERANADVARLIPTLLDRYPLPPGFSREMFSAVKLGPLVRPLEVDVVGDIGTRLWVLFGTVGIVLLVACANVANLFLVRAEGRQQELAVRMALGAGTNRVARELLSESLLLGLVGGAFGLGLAYAGIRLLVYLQPAQLPRLSEITLDPLVIGYTLAVSIVAGLLFGIIPILKYARPQLANALKENGRGSSDGRERHRARNTLVVAQVAMAVVLLVASGLMVRTFLAMREVSPGFTRPEDVLTLRLTIPARRSSPSPRKSSARISRSRAPSRRSAASSRSASSNSVTMDGIEQQRPDLRRGLSRARRAAATTPSLQVAGTELFRNTRQPGDRRARVYVGRHRDQGAGHHGQRELRARVLGRAGEGARAAHPQHAQGSLARDHRRRRRRVPGRRDARRRRPSSTGRCTWRRSGASRASCSARWSSRCARRASATRRS